MLQIKRILCPIDFSDFSTHAFDYAVSLARHYGAELYAQHVVQPIVSAYAQATVPNEVRTFVGDMRGKAAARLEQFVASRRFEGKTPRVVITDGGPSDAILSLAKSSAIDLIVMGTHGRRGFDRLMLGSVTEAVLHKAECPVLVIRKPLRDFVSPDSQSDPVKLKKILFCADFSPSSARALDYALSLATEYGAELSPLHVLPNLPSEGELPATISEAVQKLGAMIPAEASEWCKVKPAVRVGKPYQEIIQFAIENESDLIVMGASGHNAFDRAMFGSTTHRVIQFGSAPVLCVRIPQE